jgi:hypothetical protein
MASLHEAVATKICNNNPKRKKNSQTFYSSRSLPSKHPFKKKTPEVIISEIVFKRLSSIFMFRFSNNPNKSSYKDAGNYETR